MLVDVEDGFGTDAGLPDFTNRSHKGSPEYCLEVAKTRCLEFLSIL